MKLILENPYRIAGILANSSEKELQKQKSKISKYASIGKIVDSEFDFPFIEKVDRSINSINKAFSEIEQNHDKVSHSLFWFLKSNAFDETAINYLINGDKEKAIDIWRKLTEGKEVTNKNYSCLNNIGTIKLLSDSKEEIREGIESKIKLIESDLFIEFVANVADQTYSIDHQKQIEKFINDVLQQLKSKHSNSEILQFFSNCNRIVQNYLSQKLCEESIYRIESYIEDTKDKRKVNKKNAYDLGLRLFFNSKDDLETIKSLVGTSDLKYKITADSLAKEVMQCGIDYFKEWQDSIDPSQEGLKLLKLAKTYAVGSQTIERINSNIDGMEEFKEKDITQAIVFLRSVRDAFQANERKIRQQVKQLEATDISIRMGYSYIDDSKVEKSIRETIDWDKVNELLKVIIPDDKISQIKACPNYQLKTEFTELVNWLVQNSLSNYLISQILDKYRKIPPKLPFKILSSKVTNTNDKPLFTKYIRFIGLSLNVEVLFESNVTFNLKYLNPNGKLIRNSTSPLEYSQSTSVFLNNQCTTITLPGRGNANDCAYILGEYKIEVYVDEYLIHTKPFLVELAPSEKIENELKNTKEALTKAQQKEYYSSEIKAAKDEMNRIRDFQLFRAISTKKIQIESQQKKIDHLIQKSKEDKTKDIDMLKHKISKLEIDLSLAKY